MSYAEAPQRGTRAGLRVIQLGAIVIVLLAVTWREFELDRFFVPKELVLHVTALLAAGALLRRGGVWRFAAVDFALAVFLALGIVSALFATNGWLAVRAVTITASGLALFWAAGALGAAGLRRPLVAGLALAVVLGTSTSLVQAYGVTTDFFSINRAPGGTFGNRNFIAHLAAFGLPLVLLAALAARRWYGYVLAGAGSMLVVASLVLTRSRAGWLAFGAVMIVIALAVVMSRALRRDRRTWLRLGGIVGLAAAGAAAAVLVPNSLQWRSDNPYLDSIRGVANYQEGSGAGRLVQYRRSLSMAASTPLLGTGPGNWPVEYPSHAAPGDPSLSGGTPGTTSNPWPSSDWVAFASERGFPAALLLLLAFAGLALGAVRRLLTTTAPDDALAAAAMLAIIAAAVVAGMFDAVLLLAWPTFIVWVGIGALRSAPTAGAAVQDASGVSAADPTRAPIVGPSPLSPRRPTAWTVLLVLVLAVSAVGVFRSSAQLTAMGIYAHRTDSAWLARAALIDPGNYRLRVRLARPASGLNREARCRHADAAHALLPSAREARDLSRRCSG